VKTIQNESNILTKPTPIDRSNFNYDLDQHRFLSNVTIVFGLSSQPAVKYTINSVSDRGYEQNGLTSTRLKKGEKLILETGDAKYELKYDSNTDKYIWSAFEEKDGALSVTPLNSDLEWSEIKWGQESVVVRDTEYKLTLTFFQQAQN